MPGSRLGLAWLSRAALQTMALEARRWAPLESGGVLMGYRSGDAVVVTLATTAGPGAVHDPKRYEPDGQHDQAEIARRYSESGRRETYLGDWHSHPDDSIGLSRTDRRTLRGIAEHPGARNTSPVMAIVGRHEGLAAVAVWVRAARGVRPVRVLVFAQEA